VALLGFTTEHTEALDLEQPPYQFVRAYSDSFVYASSTSYAARVRPGVGHIEYCYPEYDTATGQYLADIIRHFPADIVVRAYASILHIVQLPFLLRQSPLPDVAPTVYRIRRLVLGLGNGSGLVLVAAAIALMMAANSRIGLFLLFFVLYFGGYPAIQFMNRHYFHLEFITWWAAGFLVHLAVTRLPTRTMDGALVPSLAASRRGAILLAGCGGALILTLWAARAYQQASVRRLFGGYLAADKVPLPLPLTEPPDTLEPIPRASAAATDPETADFLEVDVNRWRCGDNPTITFRYQATRAEFSPTFTVPRSDRRAPTRILSPIYNGFRGIELSDTRPGCVDGAYRVGHQGQFLLMPEVVLTPGWQQVPLYQRLRGWGWPN